MSKVYVIGVDMTPIEKFMDHSLIYLAVTAALEDSRCDASGVDSVFFTNSVKGLMEGQHSTPGEIALLPLALANAPVVNVENACAGALTAFSL